MGRWVVAVVVCVVWLCGPVESNIFGSLFGKKNGKGLSKEQGKEHYRDVYPVYWKNASCTPAVDKGRYLLMSQRNGGWNNERMLIENAVVMAWLTDRTLVIPSHLRFDHMHGEESFERFLDLSYARCHVPIVTSDILPKLTGGGIDEKFKGAETYAGASSFVMNFNNEVWAVPEAPSAASGASFEDFAEFENFRIHRPIVNQLTPQREGVGFREHLQEAGIDVKDVKIETFDNSAKIVNSKKPFFCLFYAFYWFQDKAMHNQMIELIKNGIHYRDLLWDAAYQIIKKLGAPGSFSTMHLRAGDFKEKGSYYSHFKLRSWIDSLKTFHSNTFNPGELIYISSDERNMTELTNFREKLSQEMNLKTATIYEFLKDFNIDESLGSRRFEFYGDKKVDSQEVHQFNLNDFGAIEQIVCAHGRRFVGTYFSTFSAHILRLRGYLPFETIRKEHNFWDREMAPTAECHYHSPPESCDPSWAGMFRGSMWASEYEEGWLTSEAAHARKGALKKGRMIVKLVEDPQVKANYDRLATEYAQQHLHHEVPLIEQSEEKKRRLTFAEQMEQRRLERRPRRNIDEIRPPRVRASRRDKDNDNLEGESPPASAGLSEEKRLIREAFLRKLHSQVTASK